MDSIYEEEILAEEDPKGFFNPVSYVFQFLASYGWYLVGAGVVSLYAAYHFRAYYDKWRQAREDGLYHKDERLLEGELRVREKQQAMLKAASEQYLQREAERRAAAAERRAQLLAANKSGGHVLGSSDAGTGAGAGAGADYLPLAGGANTSSYRPPKRSGCSGGSCGR